MGNGSRQRSDYASTSRGSVRSLITSADRYIIAALFSRKIHLQAGPLLALLRGSAYSMISNNRGRSLPLMPLGDLIQRLRNAKGLSQRGLADQSGLSLRSIQNWEQGRFQPGTGALVALAGSLGIGLEKLIAELGKPSSKRASKKLGPRRKQR